MKDEALKLALEALRSAAAELYRASSYCNTYEVLGNTNDAITAIQQAIAAQPAPVQEPVAWMRTTDITELTDSEPEEDGYTPLYTTPPAAQRQWVGLTDEERDDVLDIYITAEGRARAIEAKLKELNT